MRELIIDPEFKSLLFPLSVEEYSQLKDNILRDGCIEPLVIWGDILVDGHNRYQICTENNIQFSTVSKEFSGRDDVIEFILRTQLGRRNLTDFHRNKIALQYKEILVKKAKERQAEAGERYGRGKNSLPSNEGKLSDKHKTSVDGELGKIAGTNENSVYRTRQILEKGTPEQIERAERGGKGNTIGAIEREIKEAEKKEPDPPKPRDTSKELKAYYEGIEDTFSSYLYTIKNFIQDKKQDLTGNYRELKSLLLSEVQEINKLIQEMED